jgi:ketosteroid isomerase-like protein
MSQNVEVVLDQYAATNERDFRRAMSYYDDDVELVAGEPWLRTGVFKGREAVGSWFGDWFSTFDRDARFDVREARELENGAVLLVADHRARGRASGVEVLGTVIWVYRLRGGKSLGKRGSRLGNAPSKPWGCGSRPSTKPMRGDRALAEAGRTRRSRTSGRIRDPALSEAGQLAVPVGASAYGSG